MTILVKITTPNDKQARVTRGSDVDIVEPGQTREFCVHDGNPYLNVLEQAVPGISPRSGGGGRGDPDPE